MQRALERHEDGAAQVIPIILRPVDWHQAPFAKLQALPKDGRPITMWQNQDEALANVAIGVRLATLSLLARRKGSGGSDSDSEQATAPSAGDLGIKTTETKQELIRVTVQLLSFGRSYECEIPLDAKLRIVITKLVEKLNVPAITMDGRPVWWNLFSKRLDQQLDSEKTLRENNIVSGDTLHFYTEVTAG